MEVAEFPIKTIIIIITMMEQKTFPPASKTSHANEKHVTEFDSLDS